MDPGQQSVRRERFKRALSLWSEGGDSRGPEHVSLAAPARAPAVSGGGAGWRQRGDGTFLAAAVWRRLVDSCTPCKTCSLCFRMNGTRW